MTINMLLHSQVDNVGCINNGYVRLPPHNYLFTAQKRMVLHLKSDSADIIKMYMQMLTLYDQNEYFRAVSISFDLWNDTYTITLHGSEVLEQA